MKKRYAIYRPLSDVMMPFPGEDKRDFGSAPKNVRRIPADVYDKLGMADIKRSKYLSDWALFKL